MNKAPWITEVTPDDIPALLDISRKTFIEAFSWGNTEENLHLYLDEYFTGRKLWEEVSNTCSAFYFARLDSLVTGYLKLNFDSAQTELRDPRGMEIERIYVLQEFYGKGIGNALLGKALQVAQEKPVDYIWLGVWEQNPRAIRFYQKNQFVEFDRHVFRVGKDEQVDIMMKRMLKS